jgi:hypothetical protein
MCARDEPAVIGISTALRIFQASGWLLWDRFQFRIVCRRPVMSPSAWQVLCGLEAWLVTQVARRPARPEPGRAEDEGDLLAGQRAAALSAAYHGGSGPVCVALSRHAARRAAGASRPAQRGRHRHSRRPGPGEPHRNSPGAGSRAHPARHHPQNRIRKGEPAAHVDVHRAQKALTSSRISRRSVVPTTGAAAHRSI